MHFSVTILERVLFQEDQWSTEEGLYLPVLRQREGGAGDKNCVQDILIAFFCTETA